MDELAILAPAAFRKHIDIPEWDELAAVEQQAWHDSAEAVLEYHIQRRYMHRLPCPTQLDD